MEQEAQEMVKVAVMVRTSKYQSEVKRTIDWDAEDWASMTEEERSEAVFEYITTSTMMEWDWQEA